MRSWLLRGLVFAFLVVVIRLIQGALINTWETKALMISVILTVLYAFVPLIWGYFDGRNDAQAQPDPDRRGDLAMTWLLAGIVAGLLSGLVCSLIAMFYKNIYTGGLVSELTTVAAATALLLFVVATIGVAVGRFLVDRRYNKEHPVPHHGGERGEHGPDTDVFAAVGGGREAEERTQEARLDEGRTQEAPTREERTQEAPTRPHRREP